MKLVIYSIIALISSCHQSAFADDTSWDARADLAKLAPATPSVESPSSFSAPSAPSSSSEPSPEQLTASLFSLNNGTFIPMYYRIGKQALKVRTAADATFINNALSTLEKAVAIAATRCLANHTCSIADSYQAQIASVTLSAQIFETALHGLQKRGAK
jgi:hypothetical protein